MAFRAPLDVEGYIDALGDDEAELTHVMSLGPGYSAREPRLWGDGEPQASTCTDLALRNEIVWDANRYYRDLGFAHTPAMILGGYRRLTKRDIFAAIKSRGVELQDARQAYCVKQLLDREVRSEYESITLAQGFLFDATWEQYFREQAMEQSRQYAQRGMDISVEEVLDQWHLRREEPPDIDDADLAAEVQPEPEQVSVVESEWDWAFYAWQATSVNLSYMERWQDLLLKSLNQNRRMGTRYIDLDRFAVGVMGFGSSSDCPRHVARRVGEHIVFFLRNDVAPTKHEARAVIRQAIYNLANEELIKVRDKPARRAHVES